MCVCVLGTSMVPSEAREAIRYPGTGQPGSMCVLGTEQGSSARSSKCFQPLSHFSSPKVQPRNKLKLRTSSASSRPVPIST